MNNQSSNFQHEFSLEENFIPITEKKYIHLQFKVLQVLIQKLNLFLIQRIVHKHLLKKLFMDI